MAFNKSFTHPITMALGNYWEIELVENLPVENVTNFNLNCYVSFAAKESGASPLYSIDFNNQVGQLSHDDCQAIVLARPEFDGATII